MLIDKLDREIKKICPIDGIDSSGTIWFKAEATQQQRRAAQAIMDAELPTLGQGLYPVSCSSWQMRKVLNLTGLRDTIENSAKQSGDRDLKDGWNHATEFVSNDPFVLSMGNAIGKTEQEIHDLISLASTL